MADNPNSIDALMAANPNYELDDEEVLNCTQKCEIYEDDEDRSATDKFDAIAVVNEVYGNEDYSVNEKSYETDDVNGTDKVCRLENDDSKDLSHEEAGILCCTYPNLTYHFTTDKLFVSKEDVRKWCFDRGLDVHCVIVIKRSKTKNLLDNGKGSWMLLTCERSGMYIDHKTKEHVPITQKKRRRSGSRKCGCPFKLRAHCQDDGKWTLKVINGCHNHSLPVVLTGHPYVARLRDKEVKTVETMTNSGVRPRNILTALKLDNPKNKSTIRNVYNAKVKLKLHNTEGRSIMQQFMKLACSHHYSVHHRVDDMTNEVIDLFFSHPKCVLLAQCFYQILFLDCTFKTNKYKLPCFHMVSQTSTGASFTVALAFISRETTESYIWALECVRKCYREKEFPSVIITDAEIALSNAVATVFPSARHILCAWHISKNVQANCKPNFIKKKRVMIGDRETVVEDEEGKREYKLFWEGWSNVISSLSEEEYNRNANCFRVAWREKQKKSLNYVFKIWLNKYKEMFVLAWTNEVKHFDNVSTSVVESAHHRLKLYFDSAAGSFVQCWTSAHLCCENELVAIEHAFETSASKSLHRFRDEPMFKEVLGSVSHKALDLLQTELSSIPKGGTSIQTCGCILWKVNGLPCAHMLLDFRHSYGFIPLSGIDCYWKQLSCIPPTPNRSTLDFMDLPEFHALKHRYEKATDNVRNDIQQGMKLLAFPPTTNIKEPPLATIRKGRPSKKEKSTKRDPSYFEHVDAALSCSPKLTPVSRCLKKLGVKGNAPKTSQIDEHFLLQMPKCMRPYITRIDDMPADGNCGYWVVVKQLNLHNRRPENPCKFVREAMVDNLIIHSNMYKSMWAEGGFEEMKKRIQGNNSLGVDEWMQMPEAGFIIAETFGTAVVLLSMDMSFLFVPSTVQLTLLNRDRMVVMGYVDRSHFVGITLKYESPLPNTPPFAFFYRIYNINTQDWVNTYAERISRYVDGEEDGHVDEDKKVVVLG